MKVLSNAALFLLLSAGSVVAATPQSLHWNIDGVVRQALVFTPSKTTGTKPPLVFVFHGAGDTAQNFTAAGFQNAWPEAVVVYMDGLGRAPGQGGAFQTTDATANNRDLKFFDMALADLRQRFRADDARIYATGFSNGAKFVYLLWAARPQAIAAFAPVAGMLTSSLQPTVPKPILHIGGMQDHQNDIKLQMESIEMARKVNGTKAPVVTNLHGGGHIYPDGTTTLIVRFFQAH